MTRKIIAYQISPELKTNNLLDLTVENKLAFYHDIIEEWSLLSLVLKNLNNFEEFLQPLKNSSRKSRVFRLLSQYIFEQINQSEKWLKIYKILEKDENNLNWKQDFILGLLQSQKAIDYCGQIAEDLISNNYRNLFVFSNTVQTKAIIQLQNSQNSPNFVADDFLRILNVKEKLQKCPSQEMIPSRSSVPSAYLFQQ